MTTLQDASITGDDVASASVRAVLALASPAESSRAGVARSSPSRRGTGSLGGGRAARASASPAEGSGRISLQPGGELDRYTIEAVIGEGGMGRVCRAYDNRLRRRVAIKVLHVVEGGDAADSVASALREARAAAGIAHPNATAVYDADAVDGVPFIVMEFVPGTSLRQIIAGSPVPLTLRLRWLVDIAGALTAAHHVDIVHRDIKPENVMVRDDGLVKVLDFGVARRARLATSDSLPSEQISTPDGGSRLVGTPAYMPPEQIRGAPTDGRADQFAWGVLAYELLTGHLPWTSAQDFVGYIAAVLTERPEPPRTHAPEIPPQVEAAILRALAKNPANRFPSMAAAAAELAPFAQDAHGPTSAPPSPSRAAMLPSSRGAPQGPAPSPRPPSPSMLSSVQPAQPVSSPLAFEVPAVSPTKRTPQGSLPPVSSSRSSAPPASSAPPPSGLAPSSLRKVFDGQQRLREPHFEAPVDLDAHLALLPADAACKGMFFLDALKLGARARTPADLCRAAQIPDRRYVAFTDYPAAELMRLLVAVAAVAYPKLAIGEGLRRLGQTTFDTVLGTHLGRSLFAILGTDVERVLLAAPKAMKKLVNFGRFSCEKGGAHTFVLRAHEYPAFLETYQIGVIEGALRHCRANARVRIALDDLSSAVAEVRIG